MTEQTGARTVAIDAERMTRLEGKVDNVLTLIDAGDRHTSQLIDLQKSETRHLAEMQAQDRQRHHEEMAALREGLTRAIETADRGLSVVRADSKQYMDEQVARLARQCADANNAVSARVATLDSQVATLDSKVDALRIGWARATGMAAVAGLIAGAVVGAVLKGLGS